MMEMNTTNSTFINSINQPSFSSFSNLIRSLNIMSAVIYSVAFVLGVLGNGVVIWVTGFKMKKTVNTVWFLNLAVADFLFTAFLPLSITFTVMNFHWPFGKFMCVANSMVIYLNMFVSVYILVVISVDRCVSVVLPIWAQNHRSVRKASCVSLAVWVLALILSTPYFIFRDTIHSNGKIKCFNNYSLFNDYNNSTVKELLLRYQAITISRFLLGFVVPFTIIISCYGLIIHRLRRNRNPARKSSRPFCIIAAVITTFFVCWVPFHIFALLEMASYTTNIRTPSVNYRIIIGIPIASSLAFLNSCMNPLLYVFISPNFKDEIFKSIVKVLENAFHESHSVSDIASKSTNIMLSQKFEP